MPSIEKFPYFSGSKPRILAHRGLTFVGAKSASSSALRASIDENSVQAFITAQDAGAQLIESDIQVTKDGVAVLFHDDDLRRVAGIKSKVRDLNLAQLQRITLRFGARIPTLREALIALPGAKFNLDVKVFGAVTPAARIINELEAHDRVLVAAFSDRRRKAVIAKLTKPVATSGGSITVLRLWLAAKMRNQQAIRRLAKGIHVLQVPTHRGRISFSSPGFISAMHDAGLELHYWTINDPEQMLELLRAGADGLVTDRTDIAFEVVDRFRRFN